MGQRHAVAHENQQNCSQWHVRLSALHWAIVVGKSTAAQRLLESRHRQCLGQRRSIVGCSTPDECHHEESQQQNIRQRQQLFLDYRGCTEFGVEIRYSQTALALAVQFHQWDTFRQLMQSGASHPQAQQRMLVASSAARCSTRDFSNALELLLWSLTQTQYCPSHLTECELLELIRLTMRRGGATPYRLPSQLLQRLCRAAMQDIVYHSGSTEQRIETNTALHRCALLALKCLAQHGMSLSLQSNSSDQSLLGANKRSIEPSHRACCPGLVGRQLSLYHLLLCYITDVTSVRELRSSKRLRLLLCLLLNAVYGDGVSLPEAICEGDSSMTVSTSYTRLFWKYYTAIKGRPQLCGREGAIGRADISTVLTAHQRMKIFCCQQPVRLAVLARNAVRCKVSEHCMLTTEVVSFAAAVASLPLTRRLRQTVEFMDEKYLDDEISGILVRIGCSSVARW